MSWYEKALKHAYMLIPQGDPSEDLYFTAVLVRRNFVYVDSFDTVPFPSSA